MKHDTVDAARLERDVGGAYSKIREGRFQRWLSLVAGASSVLSGLEVAYEHYRGSYSQRVMYTPVILSGALAASGIAGFADRRAARTALPAIAAITLADAMAGLYFHVLGIARKPGGWRLPMTNIVMGPPIFAPLLFGVSAYLGLIAAFLRRSDETDAAGPPLPAHRHHWARVLTGEHESIDGEQDLREGRFQQQMALAAALASALSGFESWYSHYKNNFRYGVQWTPVIIAPLLSLSGFAAMRSVRAAHTVLPLMSAIAVANGSIGFVYHLRGVLRRPGGRHMLLYNVMYGPPIFAPLLFAAAGSLGLLASLLRRSSDDR